MGCDNLSLSFSLSLRNYTWLRFGWGNRRCKWEQKELENYICECNKYSNREWISVQILLFLCLLVIYQVNLLIVCPSVYYSLMHPNDTDHLLFVTVLFSVFSANVAAYNIKVCLTQSINHPLCNYFFICHFYQLTKNWILETEVNFQTAIPSDRTVCFN